MAEFRAYMWSVPDWRTDECYTALDNREQGIYRNLIDECWVAGSIPADLDVLARFVREPLDYFVQVWSKLRTKFKPIDNGERLISTRLEQDRRRLMHNAKFTEKRARKAANSRWDKARAEKELHASSIAQASLKHAFKQCQTQTQSESPSPVLVPELSTSPSIHHSPTAQKRVGGYTADFETFWAAYPKKTGKGAAFSAWTKNGHPGADQIVAVIAEATRTAKWLEDNGRYIPNPATWLNQRRWDDEYIPVDESSPQELEQIRQIFSGKGRKP